MAELPPAVQTPGFGERFLDAVLALFAAKYLGHGRATESYLTLFAGTYGLALVFVPDAAFSSSATRDLAWMGYGQYTAIPFLLKAIFSGYGLLANIFDWPCSRQFRILGAMIGLWVWSCLVLKFIWVGTPFTVGCFASGWAFYFSIRIIALAYANLPRPGLAGQL